MTEYLAEEEARARAAKDNYDKHNKLLLNLQSGIATLLDKLKDVRLKPVS